MIVYELVPEDTKFFLVPGDRSDLNGCFVGAIMAETFTQEIQDEVGSADTWGPELKTPLELGDFGEVYRVVHCGFML